MTRLTTRDGSALSPFAYGTMQWGGKADETEARAMYDACRAAGVNHFDTAWVYTGGRSEEMLGRIAAAERDALFLATKVAMVGGAGAANIRAQLDESLGRLRMDGVDLLYLHRWNDDPLDETLSALAALKAEGKFRYLGVSNFAAWQVMKFQCAAEKHGLRVDVLQPMYNVVKRQAEVELLPMCASESILPATYSPLGGGLLTGKYQRGEAGRLLEDDRYAARYNPDWMHEAARALSAIAEELGTHPATLAVAWVARHAAQPAPIISGRSLDQLQPSLDALEFNMTQELYDLLADLAPDPPPATDRLEEA